jgi:hypothetical protein
MIERLQDQVPKVCRLLEEAEEGLIAFYAFPSPQGRSSSQRTRSSGSTVSSAAEAMRSTTQRWRPRPEPEPSKSRVHSAEQRPLRWRRLPRRGFPRLSEATARLDAGDSRAGYWASRARRLIT